MRVSCVHYDPGFLHLVLKNKIQRVNIYDQKMDTRWGKKIDRKLHG